jgi:hypothetical protein
MAAKDPKKTKGGKMFSGTDAGDFMKAIAKAKKDAMNSNKLKKAAKEG